MSCPAKVTDKRQADTGGDVIGAGDEASLVAVQVEASLDGSDDRVDEAVDYHPLQEGAHTKEEQHPVGAVEHLESFGSKRPPTT